MVKPPSSGFGLANRVLNLAVLPTHFAALVRIIDEYLGVGSDIDPERVELVDPAMTRIATKIIEWSLAILAGELSALPLTKPNCTISDASFVTDLIMGLRRLAAIELKKVLPPEDFQAIRDRAIEVLDEPWSLGDEG